MAGLAGLAWFLGFGGGKTLDPTQIDWAMTGDWAQHVLGWLFFRNADWGWPPGSFDSLAAPSGASVGFTDSLPWLALLLKPLPFLPADFQYIGLWLASCFVLQGVFGARLLRGVGASPLAALAGGCLLVLAPALANRIWHDALCAHWLLLAMLHLHAVDPKEVRAPVVQVALFPILAAGVHPYLTAMTAVLALGVLLRWSWFDGFMTRRHAMAVAGGLGAVILGLWWAFGYLEPGSSRDVGGFGYYSADLLTFFNPMKRSQLLPRIPIGRGQYEGFAYLGLGNLIVFAVAVTFFFRRREARQVLRSPRVRIVTTLCAAMALFALSSRVTLAGETILSMRRAYALFDPLTTAFRSSGRFIWPLYYLVIVGSIVLLVRYARRPRHAAISVLLVALGLQVWDQSGYLRSDRFPAQDTQWLDDPAWEDVPGSYDALVAFPTPLSSASAFQCSDVRAFKDRDIPLAHLAYRLGLTFNGGSVARVDPVEVEAGCEAVGAAVHQCQLGPGAVYVLSRDRRRDLEACGAAHCGNVDGLSVCVHRENSDTFALFLASREEETTPPARHRRRRHRRRAEARSGAVGIAMPQAPPGAISSRS